MQKYAVHWPEGGAASQYSVFIGQKMPCARTEFQSFRRKWPFYMDLYSMPPENFENFGL
jgi:hypothetical protein